MSAEDRGWGPHGQPVGGLSRITLSNGVQLVVATKVAPIVKYLADESIKRGFHIGTDSGGYNNRLIRGSSSSWSNHSWGLAVDLSWNEHPMGARGTGVPDWMPPLWAKHGFGWGGDYQGRADEMHWEFGGTPEQADLHVLNLAGFGGKPQRHARRLHQIPHAVLARGERGNGVRALQWHLGKWHAARPKAIPDPGAIDGRFGPATERSLRRLQRVVLGVKVDGRYGHATERHLRQVDKYLRSLK